jgi:hypothetical protein
MAEAKLGPKFYRTFKIIEHVGVVAYKLVLPPGVRLHNVLPVGLLMPYHGAIPTGQVFSHQSSMTELAPSHLKSSEEGWVGEFKNRWFAGQVRWLRMQHGLS